MGERDVKKLTSCRACGNKTFFKAFSLGSSPLANSFLKKTNLKNEERYFPLVAKLCKSCSLLQLADIVNPDLMFKNYLYVSSTSKSFVEHFEKFAREVNKRFHLDHVDLVIDIGSNDGILLKPFKKLGVKTLGVDPAKNVAQIAIKAGIDTIVDFFNKKVANRILRKYGKAKIITAANVFAHTNNWDEFVESAKILLTDDGVLIIEAPYLLDFIKKNLFDTVYHEHLSYIAVRPLIKFFKKHRMFVFDVQKVSSHGGSIRVFVKNTKGLYKLEGRVYQFLKKEKSNGLALAETYKKFSKKIEMNKKLLVKMLNKLKADGNKIVGYGAPAKGNTLLNYFGIGPELIDYIVDDSKLKQELYTPGTHIRINPPNKLKEENANYILILAWNFADKIIENHSYLKKKGVKFVIPVPVPRIVN